MKSLRITSTLSELHDPFCRDLAEYLSIQLDRPVEFVDAPWQDRRRLFLSGGIDAAWLCGGEYVRWAEAYDLAPLAAPVMEGAEYNGMPVYFSRVVVQAASAAAGFEDLVGARLAFNEEYSFSGRVILDHYLEVRQLTRPFFGARVFSGSHTHSAALVLRGEADAAALDSMVLDLLIANNPELLGQLRVLKILGPFPSPAWIVQGDLQRSDRRALEMAFAQLHEHSAGRPILAAGGISRYVVVGDAHFEPVRGVLRDLSEHADR